MTLTLCPVCKKISERKVFNFLAARELVHVVGINKEPIYHGYCCVRPNGPENFGKVFTFNHVRPGERPE